MKKFLALISVLLVCVPFVLASDGSEYYGESFARLSYVQGDVFILRAEGLGDEEATVNLPVVEGDMLGTRDGLSEIHLGRNNYLRIDRYTKVDIVGLPQRDSGLIGLQLLSGSIYLRVDFLRQEKDIEIHSPDASFYILDQGLYRFDVRENQETEFQVLRGEAEVAGEEGSVLVKDGERVIAASGYFLSEAEYVYARSNDNFDRWNQARDALLNRAVARPYLPSELYEYEVELANYGTWTYERPYGYVWVPSVTYSWQPYYYGRWVWYPVIGWTWVSNEPWGWCVSHYGRWHWRGGLGWYWIPTSTWGPAWVQWYGQHDYVGWCPLSYYGYPVVIQNNYFYGRFYNRDYPASSRALVVVHKNQLQARHISDVALSRGQVSTLGKISLSAQQPLLRPSVSRVSLTNSDAAKALSRANVRQVGGGYTAAKTKAASSQESTAKIRSLTRGSVSSSFLRKEGSATGQPRRISPSGINSVSPYRSGTSSSVRSKIYGRLDDGESYQKESSSSVRNYPSRRSSAFQTESQSSSSSKPGASYFGGSSKKNENSFSSSGSRSVTSRIRTYGSRISSPAFESYKSQPYQRIRSDSSRFSQQARIASPNEMYPSESRSAASSSRFHGTYESYKHSTFSTPSRSQERRDFSSSRSLTSPRIQNTPMKNRNSHQESRVSAAPKVSRSSSNEKVQKKNN